ncbi:CD225/dispanin family protein [Amycolatopsis rhabdoformis]|uniref:CD225/dispanin family protein n=1 Tax=Amycolatopsis rhabdoformis TaxID=1448059 RepID=A0ABZ1IK34_9PSEU|nr:CD225/dispanin family protein [Amycolatopsis rhabdoformis]WSE34812.1 CD225/dispanin family protein [Amycolatopsis rhabdoformis]
MTGPYPPPGGPYPPPPGGPYYGGGPSFPPPPPDNRLVWGILTTIFCCLPLGIVSIVKAGEVNSLWYQGRFAEAHRAADLAGKWAMWSALALPIGLVVYVLVVLLVFLIGGASVGFWPS